MPATEKEKEAWEKCDFCSKSTYEIAEMIRDVNQWDKLPLDYKCAWTRICQVGFGRFGRTGLWQDLCYYRANINNVALENSSPRFWKEYWCGNYLSLE